MQTNEKTRRSNPSLKNKNEHNDLQNENLKATSSLPVKNNYDDDDINDDEDNVERGEVVSMTDYQNYETENNEEDEDGYVEKKGESA